MASRKTYVKVKDLNIGEKIKIKILYHKFGISISRLVIIYKNIFSYADLYKWIQEDMKIEKILQEGDKEWVNPDYIDITGEYEIIIKKI